MRLCLYLCVCVHVNLLDTLWQDTDLSLIHIYKEKSKHIGINSSGIWKKQIIIKTEKMYQRKRINTREELEMMKNGLLEMFNLPITDHAEGMNATECRRTMKEILGGINNQSANKNFSKHIFKRRISKVERHYNQTKYDQLRKSIRKGKLSEIELRNQPISRRKSMTEIRLTSLSNKHHQVIAVGTDAKEHMVLEEWLYQVEEINTTGQKQLRTPEQSEQRR